MVVLLCLFLLLLSSLADTSQGRRVIILVDPFTTWLSGHCKEYCAANGIDVIETVSPYTCACLSAEGREVPESLRAPLEGEEESWLGVKGLKHSRKGNEEQKEEGAEVEQDEMTTRDVDEEEEQEEEMECFVISESDAGVSTAERLQVALKCKKGSNGISHHLRNKFEQNQIAKESGLPTVQQVLSKEWGHVEDFLNQLWKQTPARDRRCIVKPCRGVASDGVFLCKGLDEAKNAFGSLLNKAKYGGGINECVLVQEFVDGEEYAVDTVAMDGNIKVVALWRYKKLPANGAPFVYQCTELIDTSSIEAQEVMNYCLSVLKAQNLKWGPTHTEIKRISSSFSPSDGSTRCRLIEINARWHAAQFQPVTKACLGYDALEATMDSFFNPSAFASLPSRPKDLQGGGLILHLISFKKGTVSKINHQDEISSLRSTILVELEFQVGSQINKTVDIRSDCGYVLLAHSDPAVVQEDFQRILKLQQTMIEVDEEEQADEVEEEIDEQEELLQSSNLLRKEQLQQHQQQSQISKNSVGGSSSSSSSIAGNAVVATLKKKILRVLAGASIILSTSYLLTLLFVTLLPSLP